MKQKKAAIGLSINFIVILIISITVLGLSIAFIRKLYTGATKTQETYYQQFEKEMESLACDSLDRVCIGKNRKVVKDGVAVFTMRILNVLGSKKQFNVGVTLQKHMPPGGAIGNCPAGCPTPLISQNGQFSIDNNEARTFIIAFDAKGKPSGTYINDVAITAPPEYANEKQKLYVVVP